MLGPNQPTDARPPVPDTGALGAARWLVAIRRTAAIIFVVFGIGKFVNHASELASFRLYGLPIPGVLTYAIGGLEIVGGLLLVGGVLVRGAAVALGVDMVGAIVFSGIGKGEVISLTLAPALLAAMILVSRTPSRPRRCADDSPGGCPLSLVRP
ncbi:MAG: DoxX family protein [Solirubrobacteraceae bacterium]